MEGSDPLLEPIAAWTARLRLKTSNFAAEGFETAGDVAEAQLSQADLRELGLNMRDRKAVVNWLSQHGPGPALALQADRGHGHDVQDHELWDSFGAGTTFSENESSDDELPTTFTMNMKKYVMEGGVAREVLADGTLAPPPVQQSAAAAAAPAPVPPPAKGAKEKGEPHVAVPDFKLVDALWSCGALRAGGAKAARSTLQQRRPEVPASLVRVKRLSKALAEGTAEADAAAAAAAQLGSAVFAVVDGAIGRDAIGAARAEAESLWGVRKGSLNWRSGKVGGGNVGKGAAVEAARGDEILWLSPQEMQTLRLPALTKVLAFVDGASEALIAGLGESFLLATPPRTKAMLAVYLPGSGGYRRHIDNPNLDGRRLTAIVYLNPGWKAEDGGQLLLYNPDAAAEVLEEIAPIADRACWFESDKMPHEVAASSAGSGMRMALTVWYFEREERAAALKTAADSASEEQKPKAAPARAARGAPRSEDAATSQAREAAQQAGTQEAVEELRGVLRDSLDAEKLSQLSLFLKSRADEDPLEVLGVLFPEESLFPIAPFVLAEVRRHEREEEAAAPAGAGGDVDELDSDDSLDELD